MTRKKLLLLFPVNHFNLSHIPEFPPCWPFHQLNAFLNLDRDPFALLRLFAFYLIVPNDVILLCFELVTLSKRFLSKFYHTAFSSLGGGLKTKVADELCFLLLLLLVHLVLLVVVVVLLLLLLLHTSIFFRLKPQPRYPNPSMRLNSQPGGTKPSPEAQNSVWSL